jgi:adenylate cyclase
VIAARREFRSARSLTQAFGGLYLGTTLERLDRRQSSALAELAAAASRGDDPSHAARHLRTEGFTGEELAVLERSARELSRVDELLRRYVGPQLADRLSRDPTLAQLGGVERDVTALFADLVSFTPFTEANPAASVVDMLNAYWEVAVPAVVEEERGLIERFAGDAILVLFNALGDQPDHPVRAARTALAMIERSESVRSGHDDWPRFRIGIESGPVVVGNIGAGPQRTFSAIGDAMNVAARLQGVAPPGRIAVGPRAWSGVEGAATAEPLGPVDLKGKREPVEAWLLVSVAS